jgi:hypothetical protein
MTGVRTGIILAGVALVVLGAVLFDRGILDSVYPLWGWLIDAAIGGGVMGLGAGLSRYGLDGDGRLFRGLKARLGAGGRKQKVLSGAEAREGEE